MGIFRLFPAFLLPPAARGGGGLKRGFLFLFRPRIQTGASLPKCAGAVFFLLFLFFSNSFALIVNSSGRIGSSARCTGSATSHYVRVNCSVGSSSVTATCTGSATIPLPAGYTAVAEYSFVSGVYAGECSNSTSCSFTSNLSANTCYFPALDGGISALSASVDVTCFCSFRLIPNSPSLPLPSCSDPVLISSPVCKGGQGLFMRGSKFHLDNRIIDLYGFPSYDDGDGFTVYSFWDGQPQVLVATGSPPGAENNPSTIPGGSQCNFNDSGQLVDYMICPLGLDEPLSSSSSAPSSSSVPGSSSSGESSNFCDDEANKDHLFCVCKRNPNDPKCVDPFASSGSGGGSGSSSCKIMIDGVCKDKPSDCGIMINGVCMDKPGDDCDIMVDGVCIDDGGGPGSIGGEGDGTGGGISCKLLNNCDWSRIGPQLDQIGVTKDMKKLLEDLLALYRAGYSLSGAQLAALDSLGRITSGGTRDVLGALRDLKALLETDAVPGTGEGGSGGLPEGACDPRVSDCSHNFGDIDTAWGLSLSGAKSLLSGSSVDSSVVKNRYASILADTSKVFPSMRAAVTPFREYISAQSSGCGTVLDFSFDIAGFHCGSTCKIDISNFGGKNIKKIISDLFTVAFGLGVLVRLLYVVRTIGQRG
jgi:hypothetical protein